MAVSSFPTEIQSTYALYFGYESMKAALHTFCFIKSFGIICIGGKIYWVQKVGFYETDCTSVQSSGFLKYSSSIKCTPLSLNIEREFQR